MLSHILVSVHELARVPKRDCDATMISTEELFCQLPSYLLATIIEFDGVHRVIPW
jgi:hypothetical protein